MFLFAKYGNSTHLKKQVESDSQHKKAGFKEGNWDLDQSFQALGKFTLISGRWPRTLPYNLLCVSSHGMHWDGQC